MIKDSATIPDKSVAGTSADSGEPINLACYPEHLETGIEVLELREIIRTRASKEIDTTIKNLQKF